MLAAPLVQGLSLRSSQDNIPAGDAPVVHAGQMYSSMQFQRSLVMQNMVNILYDKTNDAQEGVLSMLLVRCVALCAAMRAAV